MLESYCIIFKPRNETWNNHMICKKDFRIFDKYVIARYVYVKDIGQGLRLPENLDFN